MRSLLSALLLAFVAPHLSAQCKPILQGLSASQVTLALCPTDESPAPGVGDELTIAAGEGQFVTKVTTSDAFFGQQIVNSTIVDPRKAEENLLILSGSKTATVKYGGNSITVTVQPKDPLVAENYTRYEWSVGQAKADEESGDGPNAAETTGENQSIDAIRFRYSGDYARGGIFGRPRNLWQTTASLSIDTTNEESPDLVDNNRAAAAVQLTNLSLGRVFMHGKVGAEGRFDRAFHHDSRNLDLVVKASGWVPVLRSYTLFNTEGEFIAAPLSFEASFGYRDKRQQGKEARGAVFEGSANYHLFLFDDYMVTFNGTWTVSDASDRAANLPRTQKLFGASVAYLADNKTGFSAVASFQNGSAGAMLKEVRQYFIGVGLSKLKLGGKGGS